MLNAKRIRELGDNPNFISGIHTYCDRWCERCPFTSRCMSYAMEQEALGADKDDPAARDVRNEKFWKTLKSMFRATFDMIREDCEKAGIDLNIDAPASPDVEEEAARRAERRELTKTKQIARDANKYIKLADAQLERMRPRYHERGKQLESIAMMELPGHEPADDARQIIDATEIVQWYQHQIYVKIRRALSGQAEDHVRGPLLDDDGKPFPKDADGSAKVALIGIDRSIAAWATLRAQLAGSEGAHDKILDLLVLLDRLRRAVEKLFPDARAFKRPGFDD